MLPAQSLPTSLSELLPAYLPNLNTTLTSLKKSRLRIHSRLTSILSDSEFVTQVSSANNLPLIANERCGSWYVPAEQKRGSVYFKSTDGHAGQWQFSLRRLNLDLLEILGTHGGAIVVDATRRGKSMPDALSKTIPIWVAVVNRVLFPECLSEHTLRTPEDVVGCSEHWHIEQRLDGFVKEVQKLGLDWVKLKDVLGMPIRAEFISRQTSVVKLERPVGCRLLICCSASRHEHGDGDNYVQGAGDDIETWAQGLTAAVFWKHKDQLLAEVNEEQLQSLVDEILMETRELDSGLISQIHLQDTATPLFLGPLSVLNDLDIATVDAIIRCEPEKELSARPLPRNLSVLELDCTSGKLGGRSLRDKLPLVEPFLQGVLGRSDNPRILISCSSGKDLSIGVALAILCRFVNDRGLLSCEYRQHIDKAFIRQRLAYIIQSYSSANPSRATLQSVNAYLMKYNA